jgi:hypothetical protein
MEFNYTETYNKIYAILKDDFLSHELTHSTAIKITNAMSDIYLHNKEASEHIATGISDIIRELSAKLKFGGYDLDDKGNPR